MSIDEQHVALPSLYGAPAYARPPLLVPESERPFDPDELPLLADATDEEREYISSLPPQVWTPGGVKVGGAGSDADGQKKGASRRRLPGIGRLLGGS